MTSNSNFAYEIRFVEDNVVQIYDIAAKRQQRDSKVLLPTEYKEEDVIKGQLRYSKLVGSDSSSQPKDAFGLEDNGQPYKHHVVTKISKNRKSTQRNTFFMMGGAGGSSSYYDLDESPDEMLVTKSVDSYSRLDEQDESIDLVTPIKTQSETNSMCSPMQSPIRSSMHSSKHSTIYSSIHSPMYSETHDSLYSFANSNTQSAFCLRTDSSLYSPDVSQEINQSVATEISSSQNADMSNTIHTSSHIDSIAYTQPNIHLNSSDRMIAPIDELSTSSVNITKAVEEQVKTSIQTPPKIVTRTSMKYGEEVSLSEKSSLAAPNYEAEEYIELSINESTTNDSKRRIQQSYEKTSSTSKRACCIIS